jgi:hypothetical protein
MKYNSSYAAVFSMIMIFFYSFSMETPSKEEFAKQLVATRKIEIEEKELLEKIIDAYPGWIQLNPTYKRTMQETDFSIYTPKYFENLIQVLEIFKRTGKAAQHEETLKKQAILYITYVATNNILWPTIEDKLIQVNNCFEQYTLPYLKAAWERYKPTMVISTIPSNIEEPPYKPGTVEELSSEGEEEKNIVEEFPTPTTTPQTQKKESPRQFEQTKYSPKKPESQPNIFTRAINFIWNGISSVFKWIFSWFR